MDLWLLLEDYTIVIIWGTQLGGVRKEKMEELTEPKKLYYEKYKLKTKLNTSEIRVFLEIFVFSSQFF